MVNRGLDRLRERRKMDGWIDRMRKKEWIDGWVDG